METISSDLVVFVIVKRQTIEICFRRHCLMESSIKYANLRYARHKL